MQHDAERGDVGKASNLPPPSHASLPLPHNNAKTPPTTPSAPTTHTPLSPPNTSPAAPLEELEEEVLLEPELVAVPELEPEPDVAVPLLLPVGVADAAGKVDPAALTSKGADVA